MIITVLKSYIAFFVQLLGFDDRMLLKPQLRSRKTFDTLSPLSKGLVASLLLVCASPSNGFALSFDDIMDKGEISIAVYRDFPPFSYRDGDEVKGVDVEIAKVIAQELGVKLNLVEQTADENVDDDLRNAIWKGHYLDKKVADVMLHVPYDRELDLRNELVVLFAPYYREEMVVARDIQKLGKDATLAYFRFEKIAVELDSLADFYLSSAFGGSIRNNILHYPTTHEAAQALISQKAYGLMGPRSVVEGALSSHKQAYDLGKIPTPGLAKDDWLLGLAVKSDYRQLGYGIGDIIAAMVKDGRMKEIFDRFGLTYSAPSESFYN